MSLDKRISLPVNVTITGTGSYTPKAALDNNAFARIVDTNDAWIRQRTGIITRGWSSKEENPYVNAAVASEMALESAGIDSDEIDALICGTNGTGEFTVPMAAGIIQHLIGASQASAFDVQAGCSGSLYAMEVARNKIISDFVLKGKKSKVLIIGTDTLSNVTSLKDRSTCILLGDGAGAAVLEWSDKPGIITVSTYANGSDGNLIFYRNPYRTGSALEAIAEGTTERHLQDANQFSGKFVQNGREVYRFATRKVPEALMHMYLGVQHRFDLKNSEITEMIQNAVLVMHQANLRINENIPGDLCKLAKKRFGLDIEIPESKVYHGGIRNEGNTSGASLLIATDRAFRAGLIDESTLVAYGAMGAGLTWGTALMYWTLPKSSARTTDKSVGHYYEKFLRWDNTCRALEGRPLHDVKLE